MDIFSQLKRDEGLRLKPYKDSVGKLTIGIGRNLDDVGITVAEAEMLLRNDVDFATSRLLLRLPWVNSLDDARKGALVNMCFNLGLASLLKFEHFLSSLQSGDYLTASQEMLQSKWATQVGPRAVRLSRQIATGEWQ